MIKQYPAIKLLGVLGENGIPILIRASEDVIRKDAIMYLVSCLNAISELIAKGETRVLDIENYKLLVLNSKKGYTIVGLTEGQVEKSKILLEAIRDGIDRKDIPKFPNIVTEELEKKISDVVDDQLLFFSSLRLIEKLPRDVEERMKVSEMVQIVRGDVIDYIFDDFPKNLMIMMRSIKKMYGARIVKYLGKYIGRALWSKMTNTLQPRSMTDLRDILSEFSVVGKITKDSVSLIVCPECISRRSSTPICIFIEGLIEGMFNNPRYVVREKKCLAMRDNECLFVLEEK